MTRDDIFAQIKAALVELFEVDEEAITPEARLYQDPSSTASTPSIWWCTCRS